jgi:hypothetical protein
MATVTRSRKPVKPVCGTCRWLRRLGDNPVDPKSGALEINGKPYGVMLLEEEGNPAGYRLVKPDGTAYDIDAQWWVCTCPDAVWRARMCKHALALRAALAALAQ